MSRVTEMMSPDATHPVEAVVVVGNVPELTAQLNKTECAAERQLRFVAVESLDQAIGGCWSVVDYHDQKPLQRLVMAIDVAVLAASEVSLGRALRAFPHGVILRCAQRPDRESLLFALGFKRLIPAATRADQVGFLSDTLQGPANESAFWYQYTLYHYKQPPDWLNARYWANPERFDLDDEPDLYCELGEEE